MKFTLSWLKDHLETDASLDASCEQFWAIKFWHLDLFVATIK